MVFGVFDKLHEGHRAFLTQAMLYGNELIVAVARDKIVKKLKRRSPIKTENERSLSIRQVYGISKVVLGDSILGTYSVVKRFKPDLICLGYDQQKLGQDLRNRMRRGELAQIPLIQLKAYKPRKFHTSRISKNIY